MLKLKFINFEWFYSNYERIERTDKIITFLILIHLLISKNYETVYQ